MRTNWSTVKTMSAHIEMKQYKILLLQMASRIVTKVTRTGLKPDSKRNQLASEIQTLCSQLEREFKRDTTLASSADAKKELYDDMYAGGIPDWMLDVVFKSITEEAQKVQRREVA